MIPHIITNNGISVVLHGEQFAVSSSNPRYGDILWAIQAEDEGVAEALINATRRKVEEAIKLSISLTYQNGRVFHHGEKLRGYAVDKLVALVESGNDIEALANFLTKIQANPTQAVIDNLYEFLEYGKMPITKNGDFLAYKAIRSNWKDIHSGRFDNSIGVYVSMNRTDVDGNRNQTCSSGLHVCSFDYLASFAHKDGHVVVCQVNPADVVAIPSDYNNTKMRVSAYKVVDEVTDYYKNGNNILSSEPVWNHEYIVLAADNEGWSEVEDGRFDNFDEAVEAAEEELAWFGVNEVKVVSATGAMVYYKRDDETVN